jgi:hypothetical protein
MNHSFLRRMDDAESTNTPTAAQTDLQSSVRLGQLLDEKDHRQSTASGHRDLLAAQLRSLRRLVDDVRADDWKFAAGGERQGTRSRR